MGNRVMQFPACSEKLFVNMFSACFPTQLEHDIARRIRSDALQYPAGWHITNFLDKYSSLLSSAGTPAILSNILRDFPQHFRQIPG